MIGWILLGLLGLIVLAFFVPIRIYVEYLQAWRVRVLLFGTIPVWSFPVTKKPKKTKPASPKEPVESTEEKPKKKKPSLLDELKALFREEGIKGVMHFFGQLVTLLKTTLSSLARFITIRELALCVRLGGEEADALAVQYGKLSAAMSSGLTVLSQLVRVKKPMIRIHPDFLAEQTEARLRTVIWIWPFGVVGVGVVAFVKFVMLWSKITKSPKSDSDHNVK